MLPLIRVRITRAQKGRWGRPPAPPFYSESLSSSEKWGTDFFATTLSSLCPWRYGLTFWKNTYGLVLYLNIEYRHLTKEVSENHYWLIELTKRSQLYLPPSKWFLQCTNQYLSRQRTGVWLTNVLIYNRVVHTAVKFLLDAICPSPNLFWQKDLMWTS